MYVYGLFVRNISFASSRNLQNTCVVFPCAKQAYSHSLTTRLYPRSWSNRTPFTCCTTVVHLATRHNSPHHFLVRVAYGSFHPLPLNATIRNYDCFGFFGTLAMQIHPLAMQIHPLHPRSTFISSCWPRDRGSCLEPLPKLPETLAMPTLRPYNVLVHTCPRPPLPSRFSARQPPTS